jgi:beta-glucuronidase
MRLDTAIIEGFQPPRQNRQILEERSMNNKTDNYIPDFHVTDYRAPFEQYRIQSESLLALEGRKTESLNGNWHFMTDPYETCLRKSSWHKETRFTEDGRELPCDFDFDFWPFIKVPSCWNMERPNLFLYENMGLYFREFSYRGDTQKERAFLHFEGSAYRTYVFLNHETIAMHDGASTPFTVEVTKKLKEYNRILVAVDASRNKSRVPMDNTDWFNYGGIYRDVFFLRTPKVVIKDWFVRLVPDSGYGKIAIDLTIDPIEDGEALLSIKELGIEKNITVKKGKGSLILEAKPELWCPENPKLYKVELSFGKDCVSDSIGFREIKVEGFSILLNGKKRYLKGVSVHEDHITMGKSTDDQTIRDTMEQLRSLHGNFFRLAHYPHTRRFAQIADEMGVLLWEEIPVYWAIDFNNPDTFADAQNQLSELIKRDKNRCSVIIWSVGNENPDSDERLAFMTGLVDRARQLDESRLISAACLVNTGKMKLEDRLMEKLDIIGNNQYYGWYEPNFNDLLTILDNTDLHKPVIITEFGGGARAGNHGTKETMWTEEFQEDLYRKQFATMSKCTFIQGTTPWILIDFRAVRRLNRYQEGFNRKGLIDADRKTRKLAFQVVADYYQTIE